MANGIKLRRGLKTALAGTIADGEFVFCTDSGELGFKKGTVEKYVDLEKLSTDIDDLQTDVGELQANTPSLLTGQFKHNVNLFYDYNVDSKPTNNGGYLIPIAKVNPLFTSDGFGLTQIIHFSNVLITIVKFDSDSGLDRPWVYSHKYFTITAARYGSEKFTLKYDEYNSNSMLICTILDDGSGSNFAVYAGIAIDSDTTSQLRVAFDVDCISVRGKDSNSVAYNVFLPPTDLPVIPKLGQP